MLISPSLYSQNYLDINVQPTNGANIVISSGESINVSYTYYNGASPLGFIMIPNFSFNIKFEIYDVSTPLLPIYSSQSFSANWSAPGVSPWTGSSGATFTIPCSVNLSNTTTYEVIAKVTNIWMEDGDPGPGSFTASVGNIFFGQGCSNYSTTNYPWQDCTFKIANATTSGSLNIALTTTDVTCTGTNVNGTASATITGGVAPIHTFWTIGQQSLTSLQSGSYTVTSTDANGCQVTQPFTINQDPSIYFVPYQTTITGNVTWNQPLINVDGEVYVENGATLTIANGTRVEFSHHADFYDIMPNGVARLIVRSGGNLIIADNAMLTGCSGGEWDGIRVLGTGQFLAGQATATINAATIENAYIGVANFDFPKINQGIVNNQGGQITAIGTTFKNNKTGIFTKRNINGVPYLINNCNFIYNGNSLYSYTYQYEDQPTHISINETTNFTATANNFYGGVNDFPAAERGYGISCFDCDVNINNPVAGTQQFNGLTRAINANYTGSANMLSVSNVNITNCQEGIYLQGADLSEINNSTFNIATADAQDTYGVFLVGSSGTQVKGNSFIGSGISSAFDSYGLVAEKTSSGGALVFDNTFEATDFGLQTQGNNPAFKIRCNNFAANGTAHNQYSWATLPLGATNTLMNQGLNCTSNADNDNQAGNEWLDNCTSGNSDVFVDNSISFAYKAHERNSSSQTTTQPTCSSPVWKAANLQICWGVNKTPTSCNSPFAGITVNPDVDFDGYVAEVKNLIGLYQNEATALTQLIDGGNTLALLSAINTQSLGNVKNTLLNASSNLSDEVLLAYLNKTPPAGHIKQVVEQNSPVTTVVTQKLDNMNLPTGIRNQINALQTGVSERQKLENQILSIEGEIQLLINDLRRRFRNRLEKPKEKQLLEEMTRLESNKSLAKIYLDENNTINSRAKLNQIAQHNTAENAKFCTLMNCLVTVKEQNRTVEQLTGAELQTVQTVAVSETKVANNAQGISNKNPNQFIEHPIVKITNGNNLRLAPKQEEEELSKTQIPLVNFNLYPNPSTGLLSIQPNEKIEGNYAVEVINAHGQRVITQKLTDNAISLNHFGNGIYLVRLLNNNGVAVYSGRIILQK